PGVAGCPHRAGRWPPPPGSSAAATSAPAVVPGDHRRGSRPCAAAPRSRWDATGQRGPPATVAAPPPVTPRPGSARTTAPCAATDPLLPVGPAPSTRTGQDPVATTTTGRSARRPQRPTAPNV